MDLVDDFQCSCPPGFTGRRCETDIPECSLFMPCRNGGLCLERPADGGYECFCVNGWTGEHCEQSVNDCAEQPCRNGGSCIDGFRNYTCNCTVGYKGKNCEYDIDECLSDPCLNEGTCYDLPNGVFYCHCPSGYFGPQCESQTCESDPCQANNTVECNPPEQGRGFQCICRSGFSGERCKIVNYNDCAPNPCQNNGTCVDLINDFTCICPPAYTGALCIVNIDECSPNLCNTTISVSLWMIVVIVVGTLTVVVAAISCITVLVLSKYRSRTMNNDNDNGAIAIRLYRNPGYVSALRQEEFEHSTDQSTEHSYELEPDLFIAFNPNRRVPPYANISVETINFNPLLYQSDTVGQNSNLLDVNQRENHYSTGSTSYYYVTTM